MKKYTFEAFSKSKESAIEFAKEFLKDLRETPSQFKIECLEIIPKKKFKIIAVKL